MPNYIGCEYGIMLHAFRSSVVGCINIYDYYVLLMNLLLYYYKMTLLLPLVIFLL